MGLLDFFRNKGTKKKTTKTVIGDYKVTTTVTVQRGPSEYVDEPDQDYPIPKDTLRELKVYSERVANPCGFDFSAVRRHKGFPGEWWLEGANYEKACGALASLTAFEEMARAEHPGFPRIIDRLLEQSTPYSKGADGNLVPYIERDTTKKRGTVIAAHFQIVLTDDGPSSSAVVYFGDEGDVIEARVSHYDRDRTGNWSFRVDTPKHTGELSYKGSTYEEPKA